MGVLDAATNAIQTTSNVVSGTPATGISTIVDNVTGGTTASGIMSTLTSLASSKPEPNPLSNYATYDYVIGLGVLTSKESDNPDSTYMTGQRAVPLICKSANISPNNRITTKYGKFDFFIDNLSIESTIGFTNFKNSMLTTIEFEIFEPYSALMFPLALQTAAEQAATAGGTTGNASAPAAGASKQKATSNWREAVYLLTIEFRGNKEDGTMLSIPNTSRYIPIKITDMTVKVNEHGTRYVVKAFASNNVPLTKEHADLKTDVSIKGKTVQEVLQTGPQSLQAVVNQRLQALKNKKIVSDPDEIVILFPNEIASATMPATSAGTAEVKSSATTSTTSSSSADIQKKLGVTTGANKTLVQPDGQCNIIGKASLGLGVDRKGKTPMEKPGKVYNGGSNTFNMGDMSVDPKEGTFNFSQNQDISTAINEVILSSNFVNTALDPASLDKNGMRDWWSIDTQVYFKSTSANLKKTGTASRIIVYRVVPYKAHASALPTTGSKTPGLDRIANNVVKRYDFIYTGKNTEVLKFDIDLSMSFSNILAADGGMSNQDDKRSTEASQQDKKVTETSGMADGNAPDGSLATGQTKYISTGFKSDGLGGSAPDTPVNRAARAFHEALTKNVDMMNLNMEIMGDPYWIPQSGMGNYTAKTKRFGITTDGSVDYQRGQIDTYVNFRTPIDINQSTGMYDFSGGTTTGTVVEFSGLYYVNTVTNNFRGGRFTQVLTGMRRQGFDRKTTDSPNSSINSKEPDVQLVPADKTPATTENTNATMSGAMNGRENPEGV